MTLAFGDGEVLARHLATARRRLAEGAPDLARESLAAAEALAPFAKTALYTLARITLMADGSADAQRVMALLRTAEVRAEDAAPAVRAQLLFALAKAHEDLGEPERSFDYLMRGAALRRLESTEPIEVIEALVDRIIEVFDAAFLRRLAGHGAPPPRPVFVVGMPRSGTPLVGG